MNSGRLTVWGRVADGAPMGTQAKVGTWREWALDWIRKHNAEVGFHDWEFRTRRQPDHKTVVIVGAIFKRGA